MTKAPSIIARALSFLGWTGTAVVTLASAAATDAFADKTPAIRPASVAASDMPRPQGARRVFATTLAPGGEIAAYVVEGGADAALVAYREALVRADFAPIRTEPAFSELGRGGARILVTARPVTEGTLLTLVELDAAVPR